MIKLGVILLISSCVALSGFYYDNGVDQTVVHKHLNKREKREMQSEILHLLGLEHRPRPIFSSPVKERSTADDNLSSAPRFLMDVYHSFAEEESGDLKLTPNLIEKEFNVSDSDLNSMDEADIIMSFVNRGQHLHRIRHHHGDGRLWFDLSEAPGATGVMLAELRLYVNLSMVPSPDTRDHTLQPDFLAKSNFLTGAEDHPTSTNFILTLYEIGVKDSLNYVDRMEVASTQEGWITFNVSLALKHWLKSPTENFGLQLVCQDGSGRKVPSREAGLVGPHGTRRLQPFMVAFFRSTHSNVPSKSDNNGTAPAAGTSSEYDEEIDSPPKRTSRIRRQALNNNKKRSKDSEDFGGAWNPITDLDARLSRRSCQKKNLYVSFKDLGWQDWIIAPDGYAAFYCNGECSFPLNAHMNASNHAIVQTLVHLMNPYRVPKPCCAPIKLSSISVLYFDDNSNVILKKYRNMVVKSCGCH